jgi:Family of unknown function (DUF5681)
MKFQPGHSGNPSGRPRGSRNRRSLLAEKLYDENAEALVTRAIELALKGDGPAMRVCMDRICAPMKDRAVEFELPAMQTAADATTAMGSVAQSLADGDLTATEAAGLGKFVNSFAQTISSADLTQRVERLEERLRPK